MRNVKKEYEWEKEKYHKVIVRLDKSDYNKMVDLLNGVSISTFLKSYVKIFLDENYIEK